MPLIFIRIVLPATKKLAGRVLLPTPVGKTEVAVVTLPILLDVELVKIEVLAACFMAARYFIRVF